MNIKVTFLCCVFINLSFGLYEDQIGKFDWLQRYVGEVETIIFDQSSIPSRRVLVSTKNNVVASLSLKNGDLFWRHVLETTENGKIKCMVANDHYVSAITGSLLRTWDVISAALKEEIPLEVSVPLEDSYGRLFSFGSNTEDIFVIEMLPSILQITMLDSSSGSVVKKKELKAPWMQIFTRCGINRNYVLCVDAIGGDLHFMNMAKNDNHKFMTTPIKSIGISEICIQEAAAQPETIIIVGVAGTGEYIRVKIGKDQMLLHLHPKGLHLAKDISEFKVVAVEDQTLFAVAQDARTLTLHSFNLESGQAISMSRESPSHGSDFSESPISHDLPPETGSIESLVVHSFARRDGSLTFRAVVTCSDHSIHAFGTTGVLWSRDESLSSVVALETVDLPISGITGEYLHMSSPHYSILRSTLHRIQSQVQQFVAFVKSIFASNSDLENTSSQLSRDQFNLRKIIVLVTKSGKLFGMDSMSGDILWSRFVYSLRTFKNIGRYLLFVQRTTAHFLRHPQCVVVGRHKTTGEGMLVVFNPLTGVPSKGATPLINLGYHIKHASMMHFTDKNFVKPLLLIDTNHTPHLFPLEAEDILLLTHKEEIFLHLTYPGSSTLQGYTIRHSQKGSLRLDEVWSINLSSYGVITGIHPKLQSEKVHSPGRVLADRSVLYKYVNPNLAVVTTYAQDTANKNTLGVHLIDLVTGGMVDSVTHKRVLPPFHVVHSENWVVYSCFSEKFRRYEITTLELFEGMMQWNASSFSSLGPEPNPPVVERQAFIMAKGIQATTHTNTERGITTKFIIFALDTGHVIQLSKWFLDPRRPMSALSPHEEGLMPYMPELMLPPQEVINYNQTLPRVTGVFTAPTGLESTCLVLVYGLDLFSTRVFPSKMFDMLKDDFDHFLIAGVLLSLVVAAFGTRRLAQVKALKHAWK